MKTRALLPSLLPVILLLLGACGLSPELELDNRSSQTVSIRYDAQDRNDDGSIAFRDVTLAPGETRSAPLADGQDRVLYDYSPTGSVKATESEGLGGLRIVFEDR